MKTGLVVLTFDPPMDPGAREKYATAVQSQILPTFFGAEGFIDFRSQRGGPATPLAYTSLTFTDGVSAEAFLTSNEFKQGVQMMREVGCTSIDARSFGPSPFFDGPVSAEDL